MYTLLPFLGIVQQAYHRFPAVARIGWDFCGIFINEVRKKASPFRGGGTAERRDGEGAAHPVAFPYEGKVARRSRDG